VKSAAPQLLALLLKQLVTERYKQFARDEVLSRFVSMGVEPVHLVDLALTSERAAIELAAKSLAGPITGGRLDHEISELALKLQQEVAKTYPDSVLDGFASDALLSVRRRWLRARIDFYSRWLSVDSSAKEIQDLARDVFHSAKKFNDKIEPLFRADSDLWDEMIRSTKPMYKLLMKRQSALEIEQSQRLWREFSALAFKQAKSLPE
jgi:hypothetical protein